MAIHISQEAAEAALAGRRARELPPGPKPVAMKLEELSSAVEAQKHDGALLAKILLKVSEQVTRVAEIKVQAPAPISAPGEKWVVTVNTDNRTGARTYVLERVA